MRKKICSILLLIILLLNSSVMTIISTAVEAVGDSAKSTNETQEKINMDLSYTQLTNKVQNEMVITGNIERDTEDDQLYENPVITFEMPSEVEKVVINDIKVLYDDELKLGEYEVIQNEAGNQVVKIPLKGKQTKYQTDGINKGTAVRVSANVILKQDIKTADTKIVMTCIDGTDSTKTAKCEKTIKVVNASEIQNVSEIPGTGITSSSIVDGLEISTKVTSGNEKIKDGDVIYSNEIIKYEVLITNTTENTMNNMKILGYIPEGMVYAEYNKKAFSYWSETYTGLETDEADEDGVYWQDDTYQYTVDEKIKTKEILIDEIKPGEKKIYYYEAKVIVTSETDIETNIDVMLENNKIFSYQIHNIAKVGNLEFRIRQYESRTEKNEFSYNLIVKNLTNNMKNVNITLKVPSTLEIKEVVAWEKSEEVEYEIKDNELRISCKDIKENYFKAFVVKAKVVNIGEKDEFQYEIKIGATVKDTEDNRCYRSNECIANGGVEAVQITQSSKLNGERIKELKEIVYEYKITNIGFVSENWGAYSSVLFEDNIPNELAVKSVEYTNYNVKEDKDAIHREYIITSENKQFSSLEVAEANGRDGLGESRVKINLNIKTGETVTIRIVTRTRTISDKEVKIENYGMVKGDYIETKNSNVIQNILYKPSTTNIIEIDSNGNIIDGGDIPTPAPGDNSQSTKTKYSISGMAWIDNDENGQRDNDEKGKSGIKVLLYDIVNKKFITDEKGNILIKTTDENGKYTFTNIYIGQYYVVFEYDTDNYSIAEYQKSEILSSLNNDAIEKYVRMFNETRLVGITNTINLNSHRNNVDIGLVEKKSFDLKIEQFIDKITIANEKGTKEYTYNNKQIAKLEIHSKQFVGSTIAIEYRIVVTNVGELAGTINEIIDKIPEGLEFHSELNNTWSKSMSNNVSNTSLRMQELKSGESAETTIILTKTLDDKSAGTITNIAQIGISDNSKHIEDQNSENNTSTTQVLIGVSTGIKSIMKNFGWIMLVLIFALIIFTILRKMTIKKKMFMIIFAGTLASIMSLNSKVEAYSVEGTIADLQASINDSIASGYAETVAATAAKPNLKVKLVGYNKNYEGSGVFIFVDQTGNVVGHGSCKDEGKYMHTHPDETPIYGKDEDGNPTVKYEDAYYGSKSHEIAVHYGGSTQPTIDSMEIRVYGEDFPEDGQLLYSGTGIEVGQDFFIGSGSGDGIPSSFSDMESSAIWNAVKSSINPYDLSSYDIGEIKNNIKKNGISAGSCTADLIKGSSGVTSLSVTVSRTVKFVITYSISWENIYYVDEDYVCKGCGKVIGSKRNQRIGIPDNYKGSVEHEEKYSTTVTFEPEDLPKSLTIYKFDEDTKEMLYDPSNPSSSEFKFLVTNDAGGRWEVGVGESITGLHAGTYHIWEVNSPYGYGIWDDNYDTSKGYKKLQDIVINESDVIVVIKLYNKKQFIDMSGYVWEDMLNGKDNSGRNDLYDEPDKRVPGVKVILHDTVRNRELVTWTNENGEYHFGSRNKDLTYTDDTLRIADLDKYYIEFEYNGVKYRNVKLNTDVNISNASRASEERASGKSNENSEERQRFNEKFSTITSNTQIDKNNNTSTGKALDSGNKEKGELKYKSLKSHQSSIIYGDKSIYDGTSGEGKFSDAESESYGYDIYHIKATTLDNCNFSDYLEEYIKKENTTITHISEIKNINLGLYSREQVDVAIDSDVEKFMLNIDGYEHTYTYNGVKEERFNEQMDVKLKELQNKYYERQLHESSIAYSATETGKNLYAEITYKVYLQNKSELQAQIKKLKLDYDSSLILKSYNYYNETDQKRSEIIGVNEEIPTIQDGKLRETIIDLEQIKDMKDMKYSPIISGNGKNVLEITFRINANTIAELVVNKQEEINFDFMAEVESYSTYAQNEENAYRIEEGTYAYASIDKNSAAGNTPVEIDNNKFITDKFENDTTIAPTFKLSKGSQTVISGIVYEDSPKESRPITINESSKIYERVGDGEYKTSENVMKNVLVELIKISEENNYTADSVRNVNQNQKQVYSQGDDKIAHLYKTPASGNVVDTNIIARTYTGNDGKYEFKGIIPGKYVIRFVYGKNMKAIDDKGKYTEGDTHTTTIYDKSGEPQKVIEAREYKSTIITGNYISKALNITNGKEELNGDYSWFLNDKDENGRRYSDAVDDVEYRAQLEKDATVDNKLVTGNREYVYTEMQAHTAYFKLGVEANDNHNEINSATLITDGNGKLDYTYSIKNIDLGIIERPVVDLQVDKQITGLKVSLGNGQVLINGNPQTDKLPYVRGLGDFVPIEMDTEILHGATLEEEYTITIKNNSELDYAIYPILSGETFDSDIIAKRRDYYYYGKTNRLSDTEKQKAVTTRISVLGDYLGNELTADENTMAGENWEAKTIEDIANLLSEDSKKAIKDGKYTIYTTGTFANPDTNIVTIGSSKPIKYKVSKLLSTTADTMRYTNDVEILQYLGYSQNKNTTLDKNTTPGNLIPGKPQEDDEDFVRTTITPPTGTIISRWLYVTTAVAGLILVGATIIFIKKRILVK